MAHYRTTIASTKSVDEAFDYMANFANAAQWDPGIAAARQKHEGAIGLGTRFLLDARFGKSVMELDYVIAAYEPSTRLVLVAETDNVKSIDEITFRATATGCDVTYDATLLTLGSFRKFGPIVALMFRSIGNKARDGLRRELTR
jgi:hypothetical protein